MDDPTETLEFRILDRNGKVSKNSLKSAFKPPYPANYYITTVLSVIGLTVFLLWNYGVIPGTKLGYFCNDPLFSHKYTGDTVPPLMLGLILPSLFLLVYFVAEYIRQGRLKDTFTQQGLLEFYLYLKHLIIGTLLVGGTTEVAKTIVGEHRPHFFDICLPDTNFNCTNGTYLSTFTCTNSNVTYLDIVDSSRSFPSGHSSLSWFIAIYSAYIIHSRLPVRKTGTAFKIVMLLICLSIALLCSLTRITDRRHHWWDVLIGTILGLIGAAYTIRITEKQIRILKRQISINKEQIEEEEKEMEIACNV